ncbi:hypothetical protein BDW74DRAFT_168642 [Aspergillus multicolor]|uniref:uncharacterized protein n=1 Tax=Aspergillus multicolor TaxID=41759 RepID=UPI003CCCEC9B
MSNDDTKSILSMQELDPSPVDEGFPDIHYETHADKYEPPTGRSLGWSPLGLRSLNWDSWLSALQRYSTYSFSFFAAIHFANTALIPIALTATRSTLESNSFLLLTRPIYQSPSLEHAILTVPVLTHIASGIALRNIRSSRRARLYGAETRDQRYTLSFWPRMSLQARLGYMLAPLLATHVLVNRVVPVMIDGGSSSVSLSFVAHGIARNRVFWVTYYHILVFVGVYHILGGVASFMGWRVTTARKTRGSKKGTLEGDLGHTVSDQHVKRRKRMWWNFNKIATLGACVWLAGALWVIGNGGKGTGWEAKGWNEIYSHVPLVQHGGKSYRIIKEGRAYILKPPAETAATQATRRDLKPEDKDQTVFYNPIQQFNRDLTVLAIRVYGEHVMAKHKQTNEKRKRRPQGSAGGKTKKRKREEEDLPTVTMAADANGTEGPEQALVQADPPPFTILDALSASGLRALRYASEIPFVTRVVANDLSSSAIQSMELNIEYNGLEKLVQPNTGDARIYMYSRQKPATKSERRDDVGKFDVIDLDPYGSAAPFIDAAVQGIKDEGLLCITCTDAGVWASNGYPEKSFALYGGIPMKGLHSHEGGLRLILNSVALAAGKYGLAIEPLLSLSIDFYARLFVRIHRSPAQAKFMSGNTMLVYNCDSGCGAWTTQPLTQTRQKLDKKGNPFYHFGLAQAPTGNQKCEHCGMKTHLSGPMWAGPLHSSDFIQKILDLLPQVDRDVYQTLDRVEGMLTTALEEDLSLQILPENDQVQSATDDESTPPTSRDSAHIIPRTDPALREPHPFYFGLASISKVIHTTTVPYYEFLGALRHLGYRCTRSHTKPNTVRTDAPWTVIWEVMREWARQKAPIKEGSIRPGTAAAGIMAKSREKLNQTDPQLVELRKDLITAAEAGKDVSDLITKVEAALYRSRSRTIPGEAFSNPGSAVKEESQVSHLDESPALNLGCSKLDVVFDESLGRQTRRRKRLVRYQVNPRANWGPLGRASGGS